MLAEQVGRKHSQMKCGRGVQMGVSVLRFKQEVASEIKTNRGRFNEQLYGNGHRHRTILASATKTQDTHNHVAYTPSSTHEGTRNGAFNGHLIRASAANLSPQARDIRKTLKRTMLMRATHAWTQCDTSSGENGAVIV